jgi:hypothetical protein
MGIFCMEWRELGLQVGGRGSLGDRGIVGQDIRASSLSIKLEK